MTLAWPDRDKLIRIADWFAVALAASLPWSTSATGILAALWAITIIAMFDVRALRGTVMTAAGGLPVLLILIGALGVLWADVSFAERWNGMTSYFKLFAIPLFFIHFQRSERGTHVLGAFALSCVVLLIATSVFLMIPALSRWVQEDNTIVKNAASQSGEFVLCVFVFMWVAVDAIERRQWRWVVALGLVSLGMLVSMVSQSTGRTALVTIPVLLILFAIRRLDARRAVMLLAVAALLAAVAWFSAPYLRYRTIQAFTDAQQYFESDKQNSSGERLEFYRKSLGFIQQAPLFGHGTGSIHKLFIESSAGKTGASGSATANPHNQTFAVAIQTGLLGALVLWAMWIAHAALFRAPGLAAWVGLVVVAQNIVGSLFNSHLFDFMQGWTYVIGVGVAGGMVLKQRASSGSAPPS